MKDRIEIEDGRTIWLVNDLGRINIGFHIQDILDRGVKFMVGNIGSEGFIVIIRTPANKVYIWRQATGWEAV
jgi:hypothetical protein